MRILLVNYRYFISGGPERYMFNVADALVARNHEIIPFSVTYDRNHPTPYDRYFVEPLGKRDEVVFREHSLRPRLLWRTLRRLFYDAQVEHAVSRIIGDTRPQVAYVLKYLTKLSPALLVGLKKSGVPVVVRLSDYDIFCVQAHCLRNGIPCNLCAKGDPWHSIRFRCVHGSLVASSVKALAAWYHRHNRYFDLIDVIVTTNRFMYDLLLSGGFSETRLKLIPTFVEGTIFAPADTSNKGNYAIYAGRVERIKGLHILLDSLALLHRKRPDLKLALKIAGPGDRPYLMSLIKIVQQLNLESIVEFVGELNTNELASLLAGAQLVVVPSLWYENLPNAILEAYASGTPVLASDLGSLKECVRHGETGYLFRPGDPTSLAERLEYCLDHPRLLLHMGQEARALSERVYSPTRHIAMLEEVFEALVSDSARISRRTEEMIRDPASIAKPPDAG